MYQTECFQHTQNAPPICFFILFPIYILIYCIVRNSESHCTVPALYTLTLLCVQYLLFILANELVAQALLYVSSSFTHINRRGHKYMEDIKWALSMEKSINFKHNSPSFNQKN